MILFGGYIVIGGGVMLDLKEFMFVIILFIKLIIIIVFVVVDILVLVYFYCFELLLNLWKLGFLSKWLIFFWDIFFCIFIIVLLVVKL